MNSSGRHSKYEKTQRGNPHGLTIKQHFIPKCSIDRFANDAGFVELKLAGQKEVCQATSDHWAFYFRRAWNERAEKGYMKQIEDNFQALSDKIIKDDHLPVSSDDCQAIARFYALWHQRARLQPPPESSIPFVGGTTNDLSIDEQEHLEKMHIGFARKEGVPTRDIVGLQLQMRADATARHMSGYHWGVVKTERGEFVFPDTPHHNFIPLTPKILLAANNPSGYIRKSNLNDINIAMLSLTQEFFFARNINTALSGISKTQITKACAASLKKISSSS